jgi:very-short-patch-repair endonuclease
MKNWEIRVSKSPHPPFSKGVIRIMLKYKRILKIPGRILRCSMTEAENVLWERIRHNQLLGIQFYRQKPIGPYIVDFYGPAAKIVIEADGPQHNDPIQKMADSDRDFYLGELGLTVVRFENQQILQHIEDVLKVLYSLITPFEKGG